MDPGCGEFMFVAEWEVTEVPVYGLHLLGVGNKKPDPLFKSSSIADRFRIFPISFNLIAVVKMTFLLQHKSTLRPWWSYPGSTCRKGEFGALIWR